MFFNRCRIAVIFLGDLTLTGRVAEGATFQGLGDLAGGVFESNASGISADGSVVVGYSKSTNGTEAFRWANNVMTGLDDLPNGFFNSNASGVSAGGYEAFRWINNVMTGLS